MTPIPIRVRMADASAWRELPGEPLYALDAVLDHLRAQDRNESLVPEYHVVVKVGCLPSRLYKFRREYVITDLGRCEELIEDLP
jgi:hypothetical protein